VGAGDTLFALNPVDGKPKCRFHIPTARGINSSPALASDGTIYVGANDGTVYSLTPACGEARRPFTASGEIWSSPAVGDAGVVYVKTTLREIVAVGLNGDTLWTFITQGTSAEQIQSSPAIGADGTLYIGSGPYVYAIPSESRGLAVSSWPKFHHDNQNTGRASAVGISSARAP